MLHKIRAMPINKRNPSSGLFHPRLVASELAENLLFEANLPSSGNETSWDRKQSTPWHPGYPCWRDSRRSDQRSWHDCFLRSPFPLCNTALQEERMLHKAQLVGITYVLLWGSRVEKNNSTSWEQLLGLVLDLQTNITIWDRSIPVLQNTPCEKTNPHECGSTVARLAGLYRVARYRK